MARPRGEVREVLLAQLDAAGSAGITARTMFERLLIADLPVTYLLVRRTIENMVRAGEVEPVGQEKRAGSSYWESVYALVVAEPAKEPCGYALACVMRDFHLSTT